MTRHALIWLLLALATFGSGPGMERALAEEGRFDPPLEGAYLGVRLGPTSAGLVLQRVEPDGAAARAGLQEGDVLTAVGERDQLAELGLSGLADALRGQAPGPIEVTFLRDGALRSATVDADPALVRDAQALARQLRKLPLFRPKLDAELESRLSNAVRSSASTQSAYEALNRALDAFDISHTAIVPPWTRENLVSGDRHFDLGLFVQARSIGEETRFFVQDLYPGSVAYRSELLVGDEIVAVNGLAFGDSPRRVLAGYEARREIFTVALDAEETVRIEVRRERGSPTRVVELTSDAPSPDIQEATRASVRLVETSRGPLGVVRLWNLLSKGVHDALRSILRAELRDARGLIVDLRGRGGRVEVLVAVGKLLRADGRPVAVLIDRETRSAKEVLAYILKGKSRFTLIGETTAGAVRPATYFALPSGAQVMLPVGDGRQVLRFSDNVDLEARGVDPDIEVRFRLPWAAGRDPLLERAREHLERELGKRRRRARV